jgi:hypothetical protein
MQTMIRSYSGKGAAQLFDVLERNSTEIQALMRPVKGLVSYTLARSGDGGFSVTTCQDKAGLDESAQKAKDWIAKNAGKLGAAPPTVTVGNVIAHVK